MTNALFGQTKDALLSTFFGKPNESFYVNELVRTLDKGTGAVQREIKNLAAAGLVVKTKRGNRCFYQANRDNAFYPEIREIVSKSSVQKAPASIRGALRPLKHRIAAAFVFGSVARKVAKPESDIDLLIVGDVTMKDVLARFGKAEGILHREINPILYTPNEFKARLRDKNHFLTAVMAGEKKFLIGDAGDVERLGR
jgi:predicted nucleotidyltransferase